MKSLFRLPLLLLVLCLMLLTASDAFAFGRCRGGGCGGGRPALFPRLAHGFSGGCCGGSCSPAAFTYYAAPAASPCSGGSCPVTGMCHPSYNVQPGYISYPTHPQFLLPSGGCAGGRCR